MTSLRGESSVYVFMNKKIIFTIGHSTHPTREFIKMLKAYDVECLVDIRHYPGSRHCPQFGKSRLRTNLSRNGIDYIHLLSLGGRRRVNKESHLNDGWRSLQFRGYADYMQTKEFREGLTELMKIAEEKVTVIMCSEAVPWRCHRSMVSDALLLYGFDVIDIMTANSTRVHHLTSFAKVKGKKITYPQSQSL